ncbi:DUF6157 family protein [Flavimaricola marinus]|uniref:Uncharacterized protein n=1 Tax=Flavimaricola marinus TaxID=1819565 RepID=A0A238LEZ1_9RHOB|nr:DUF6157 family protein [Flavimaricola marinus]SMY07985.1 hypothetical protein LOM8899_02131 [Flavimaricola marinus]
MHSTNYTNTLILPSPDCRAEASVAPPKPGTVAALQHAALIDAPYQMTSDDLLVQITATRRGLDSGDHADLRQEIFAKGQPCLRASPLVKTYGWGVHHDGEGKVSLIARNSPEFASLVADESITKTPGMRSGKGR